jgi:hypothetical protein
MHSAELKFKSGRPLLNLKKIQYEKTKVQKKLKKKERKNQHLRYNYGSPKEVFLK